MLAARGPPQCCLVAIPKFQPAACVAVRWQCSAFPAAMTAQHAWTPVRVAGPPPRLRTHPGSVLARAKPPYLLFFQAQQDQSGW